MMKKLNKIFLLTAFIVGALSLQAQDKNNPYAVFFGTNAVDFYAADNVDLLGEADGGNLFSEYFNITDNWNLIPSITSLEVKRYIGDGFTGRLSGSINQIENLGKAKVDDLSFYNLAAGLEYNFKNLLNSNVVDPFLGIGVGYYWIDDNGATTFDTGVGVNFWFNDNMAFTIKSSYNSAFQDENFSYFQHNAGVTLAFGGSDSDGDGVYDKEDECPDTPGLAEFNGCPDSDGDGITDKEDECPDTAGLEEFNGCPDSDGDGVPDPKDECPNTAGSEALNGCPDADDDGVADKDDNCPNEAGPSANNGCPYPDTDGDGVLDKDDMCPEVAGTSANKGCPEITEETQMELNEYSSHLGFEFGSAKINENSEKDLKAILEIIKKFPNSKFVVEGHTDSIGSDASNMELSEARALAVKTYLVENGIDEFRLSSQGYGESKPVATNNTNEGRSKNRRVEINLKE